MKKAFDTRAIGRLQLRRPDDEFRTAVRAMLMAPLMAPTHADFGVVRRHADRLREWFAREAGWPLSVEREGIRLKKRPGNTEDDTRGLPEFDRRRYVLFSLACAVLERADAQVTLRTLGEALLMAASDPLLEARGFLFELRTHHERRELVAVCRTLLTFGVLTRVAGDEDAYVQGGATDADALYDVHRKLLANVLACARGPSTWSDDEQPLAFDERLEALLVEYVPDSEEGRRTALKHSLARRLLDDPVVYMDELDPEAVAYFANQRGPMASRLCEATGLAPEQRAEGTALVDPEGELTDVSMPGEGTDAHVTLLVAEHLCSLVQDEAVEGLAPAAVSVDRIEAFIASVRSEFGKYWRGSARKVGSEHELAAVAVSRLRRLHLVRVDGDGIAPMPALFRFSLAELDVQGPAAKGPPVSADLLSGEFDNA